MRYYSRDEWDEAAIEKGYDIIGWGNGSADAFDVGELVGTWTAFYDTNVVDNVGAQGWLK